jgi:transcriptional regulator with XRE-family HTH domain
VPWRPDGKRLRALRARRGWTLDELAARSGLSARQIRAIESPRPPATIQLRTVRDLAAALRCNKEQFATWLDARRPVRTRRRSRPTQRPPTPC